MARAGKKSQLGHSSDLLFLEEDQWLKSSSVLYHIVPKVGRWWIVMLFVDIHNPFRFRFRWINHYSSLRQAENYAQILQRGIRRDVRGTFKIKYDAFNICAN